MPIDSTTLAQIRDEVGRFTETGVDDDDTLELIYNGRGNQSVYETALAVYKRRLNDMQAGGYDVNSAGQQVLRSQRWRNLKARVAELEFLCGTRSDDDRFRAAEFDIRSSQQVDEELSTEYS
jgi:hypothetical protein